MNTQPSIKGVFEAMAKKNKTVNKEFQKTKTKNSDTEKKRKHNQISTQNEPPKKKRKIQQKKNGKKPTVNQVIQTGLNYYNKKKYDQAEISLRDALRMDSQSATAWYCLALVYEEFDQQKAINYYKEAVSLKHNYYDAHYNLATIHYENKHHVLAIKHYCLALEVKPKCWQTHYNVAKVYNDKGGANREAIKHFLLCVKINTKYYDGHYELANSYLEEKEYENACVHFKACIDIDSSFYHSYYNIGYAYHELGQYDTAISYYKQALTIQEDVTIYSKIANSYHDKKNYDKALKFYLKSAKLNPGDAAVCYNLALLLQSFREDKDVEVEELKQKQSEEIIKFHQDAIDTLKEEQNRRRLLCDELEVLRENQTLLVESQKEKKKALLDRLSELKK